jgi:hypothetical protein
MRAMHTAACGPRTVREDMGIFLSAGRDKLYGRDFIIFLTMDGRLDS